MCQTFLIAFEIKNPGNRNLSEFYNTLKSMSYNNNWQFPFEGLFIIETNNETALIAKNIYNKLHPQMIPEDNLFILDITFSNDYSGFLPKSFWPWFKNVLHSEAHSEAHKQP